MSIGNIYFNDPLSGNIFFNFVIISKTVRFGIVYYWPNVNTVRPRRNGPHFADDTFKRIFMNENVRISIIVSLKFVPKGLIRNIPALVQIMAWHRAGDIPSSEPMMVNLLTHICVTGPQWVNCIATDHLRVGNYKFWNMYHSLVYSKLSNIIMERNIIPR